MTEKPIIYIPCLRWKLGEYQAVSKLSSLSRDSIIPIIEIPEEGYDFENRKNRITLDEHLELFTSRIYKKWGVKNKCYIDLHHIPLSNLLANGKAAADFVFEDLTTKKINFTPVTRLNEPTFFIRTLTKFIENGQKKLCLRVNLDEFAEENFEIFVGNLLEKYDLNFSNCDLILDLESINFDPIELFSNLMTEVIKSKSKLNQWSSFGILGTSFPQNLAGVPQGLSFLPRNEWIFYKNLIKNLKLNHIRIPNFGDYTINHPEILTIDPRFLKPKANIRYTILDNWLISRGLNVRDHKYEQFRELCKLIIKSKYFCGEEFSFGDEYIYNCAQGKVTTGNLSTWRQVGTNHHIEMVVQDLSNLAFS